MTKISSKHDNFFLLRNLGSINNKKGRAIETLPFFVTQEERRYFLSLIN